MAVQRDGGLSLLDEPSLDEVDELSSPAPPRPRSTASGRSFRRWLQDAPYLNLFAKREVIRAICYLPGCYPLAYLDEPTFRENEAALADDPFPLRSYRSQDAHGRAVDPYAPVGGQYPADTGFDKVELAHGGTIARQPSAPTSFLHPWHRLRHDRRDHLGAVDHNPAAAARAR